MFAYFLFFFYLVSGTIFLHWMIRKKKIPFSIYHTVAIVFFKIAMGCLYGWIFLRFYGGDDTWGFFNDSKLETGRLLHHPLRFLDDFMPSHYQNLNGNTGWDTLMLNFNQFENTFMVKGLAVLNLLSGKNYYIDVLLFDFLTIAGPLLLFKLLVKDFPLRSGMHFLLIFFIPSVIFWCSGIRAEAIILLAMVVMIHSGQAYALHPSLRHFAGILAGLLGLLLVRFQFLLVFLPAFAAYMFSVKSKRSTPVLFNRIFLVGTMIFIASLFLPPTYQLSRPIQATQQKFFNLHGNTRYMLDSLESGPLGFLKILPQALVNSTLRPFPWEGKNLLQSVSAVEVLFLIAGILFFILSPRRREQISHPVYWLFLYYGLSQLLLIGYTVPFPGAIVRYRSIAFLFVVLFLNAGNPLLQQKLRYWIFKLH